MRLEHLLKSNFEAPGPEATLMDYLNTHIHVFTDGDKTRKALQTRNACMHDPTQVRRSQANAASKAMIQAIRDIEAYVWYRNMARLLAGAAVAALGLAAFGYIDLRQPFENMPSADDLQRAGVSSLRQGIAYANSRGLLTDIHSLEDLERKVGSYMNGLFPPQRASAPARHPPDALQADDARQLARSQDRAAAEHVGEAEAPLTELAQYHLRIAALKEQTPPSEFVTVRIKNTCQETFDIALLHKNLAGEWVTTGWYSPAPGETATPKLYTPRSSNMNIYYLAQGQTIKGGSEGDYEEAVSEGPFVSYHGQAATARQQLRRFKSATLTPEPDGQGGFTATLTMVCTSR